MCYCCIRDGRNWVGWKRKGGGEGCEEEGCDESCEKEVHFGEGLVCFDFSFLCLFLGKWRVLFGRMLERRPFRMKSLRDDEALITHLPHSLHVIQKRLSKI
jgi:hypothetical protein